MNYQKLIKIKYSNKTYIYNYFLYKLIKQKKMKKCITFGSWNKYYLFIIAEAISINIYCLVVGNGYHTYSIGLFTNDEYFGHLFIHKFFYFLLVLILALLFLLYENKRDSNKNKSNETQIQIELSVISYPDLIYTDIYSYTNKIISNKFVFLIIFLYVLFEHIDQMVKMFFSNADYWMLELLIMSYLNHKMFKLKIYKHQLISIYLISIPIILKSVTMALLFFDENNYFKDGVINYRYKENSDLFKILYVAHWWLFPIALIIFFIIMTVNSYLLINIKKIIDLKYVSITKVLILYGIVGIIFTSFISLITTFISCGKKIDSNIYDIYDYICKVVDDNGDRFVESYSIYFNGDFWKDVIKSIVGSIGTGICVLFGFQIVQYLNPIYKSFSSPLTYFLQKLILIYQLNDNEPIKYLNTSFFLDLSSDLTAILGFLIYLEIVELNFCDLNKDLRKNIITRGINESKENVDSRSSSFVNLNDDNEMKEIEEKYE